jgi:hypothetical protein
MKKAGYFALLMLFVLPVAARAQDPTQEAPPSTPPAAPQAPAQTPPVAAEIYTPKYELSAGYNYRKFYFNNGTTLGMNGGYASVDRNFKRWLGAFAEISAVYRGRGLSGDSSIYTLLIGPQLYPFGHRKLTPFGHVLFGAGYYRNAVPANGGFSSSVQTFAGTDWGGGGGLDMNLRNRKHLGIRLIEVDYDKAHFYGGNIDRGSIRVSVGIVYRFGEK